MKRIKPKKNTPLIILTAGGTGGHVYPAEALAEELAKRGYRLMLVTDSRGKDNYKGKLAEIPNVAVSAGSLVGKSVFFKLKSLFKLGFGVLQALRIILKEKPICYPRLVAHCIREIISLLTRSINRTPDWRIGLKNAARVLDKKNEVLKGNYQDTLEYILSEADTQPQRIELLKEAILKLDNFITKDA